MAAKDFQIGYNGTGLNLYAMMIRNSDKYILDADSDTWVASAAADPYLEMTEHGEAKRLYTLNLANGVGGVWVDGAYKATFYRRLGASPNPASDEIVGLNPFEVSNDTIVTFATLSAEIAQDVWRRVLSLDRGVSGSAAEKLAGMMGEPLKEYTS